MGYMKEMAIKKMNEKPDWHINTVDLDHSAKAVLFLILNEIKKCKFSEKIEWRESPSRRGFHIKFICKKNCCKCRKLYDDQLRINADLTNRKEYERNVLWDVKAYVNSKGEVIYKKAGKWHKYK